MRKNTPYKVQTENGEKIIYDGRYVAICAIVFFYDKQLGENMFLLNKRGSGTPNYQGMWNFTCGFLEGDETGEEGCSREVYEETGFKISPKDFHIQSVQTDPKKDSNVTLRYVAHLNSLPEIDLNHKGGDEVSDVSWFDSEHLLNLPLAFNHKEVAKEIIPLYNFKV